MSIEAAAAIFVNGQTPNTVLPLTVSRLAKDAASRTGKAYEILYYRFDFRRRLTV